MTPSRWTGVLGYCEERNRKCTDKKLRLEEKRRLNKHNTSVLKWLDQNNNRFYRSNSQPENLTKIFISIMKSIKNTNRGIQDFYGENPGT